MSEFSAILDVISCVVSAVFETTLDVTCGAFLLVSCAAVWRWTEIADAILEVKTRSDWRECCASSAFLSLFDCVLLPASVLIVFAPLRWGHIRLLFAQATPRNYDAWDFRGNIFSTACCSVLDIIGCLIGSFVLLSPFGRTVTVWKSRAFYFRAAIMNDFDDRTSVTSKWSRKLIQHGLATLLDWIIVVIFIPFFLLAPSVWITTFTGLNELMHARNMPSCRPHEYHYVRDWMDWYATMRTFLYIQIQHAFVDILLAPLFLLVCVSPLRLPILLRTIKVENEKIRLENQRYHASHRVDSVEYNYSVDLRAEICVLALLAVADLLLLPMLLPLWLTQYRYRAIAKVLWPAPAQPAVQRVEDIVTFQSIETAPPEGPEVEQSGPAPWSAPTGMAAFESHPQDLLPADTHAAFDKAFAIPTTASSAAEEVRDVEQANMITSTDDFVATPASFADVNVYTTPAVETTTALESPQNKLWGTKEFFLIAAQAGLLLCDVVMLLLPLPILFCTRMRWNPVWKILQEDSVFLDRTSKVYGTVMDQMSLLLLDVILAPVMLVVLCTVYRAAPLWQIMANLATIEYYNVTFHWAIMVNFACVVHDVCLLCPMVLMFPCLLAAYRAPIVRVTVQNHLTQQRHDAAVMVPTPATTTTARGDDTGVAVNNNIRILPAGKIRYRLWLQVLYSIVDLPFMLMSAFVFFTLWRAWELAAHLRYATSSTRGHYNELSDYDVNWMLERRLRWIVAKQFAYLLRDAVFLLPMAVVIATLYRLPQLLGQFVSALLAGGVALSIEPMLDVKSCHLEFAARGGAAVNFGCTKRLPSPAHSVPPATGEAAAAPTDSVKWDPTSKVELHVVADAVWEAAGNVLGKFLVSLVRGYLPLKLEDKKSIGWSEFVSDLTAAELLEQTKLSLESPTQSSPSSSAVPSQSLWMKLDFGTTKRTTLLKKLRLMPAYAVLRLQLETYAEVTSNGVTTRKKVVLLRASPSIRDLIAILDSTPVTTSTNADSVSGALPIETLLAVNNTVAAVPPAEANSPKSRDSNFVNSFNVMVTQSFVEIVIDFGMLLMIFFAMLSPLRFVRLLVALLEPESALPMRVCANTLRSVHHLDNHLLEYRKQVGGPLNHYVKSKLPSMLASVWDAYIHAERNRRRNAVHGFLDSIDNDVYGVIEKVETYHLKPYQKLCRSAVKSLSFFAGCEKMEALLTERLDLHQAIVKFWFLRIAADVQLLHSFLDETARAESRRRESVPRPAVEGTNTGTTAGTVTAATQTQNIQISSARCELMLLIFTEEHDKMAAKLQRNELQMKELVASMSAPVVAAAHATAQAPISCKKRVKSVFKHCGLLTRPIADTRKLILLTAYQALTDIGFALLLLFMLVTVVRALPMLRELRDNKTWSPLRYTTRWILIKHVKLLAQDVKHIGKFCLYTVTICITVGGIPSFLADLPYNLDSFFSASECAKLHARKVFKYICHLLSFLTVFRTYRIVVKAALYCAIIPGACLAEAFPVTDFSAAVRVTIGLIVWAGLLVGSIIVSVVAVVGDDPSSAGFVHHTRLSLLAWGAAVFGVLLVCALSVCTRPAYLKPDCHAVRSPELTWSHILAVLTGPVESIQLSAVVLYFFWDFARGNDNNSITVDTSGKGLMTSLGGDSFAAALLVWAPSPDSDGQYNNGITSSSDGSSDTGFRSSIMVAALLVMVWALMIAAPIATSVAEGSRRREKVMAFKHSPVYEFLVVVLSRLLTVWIIATLMRSTSCLHVDNSFDDGEGYAVVSTAQNVSCGEGDWWASLASLSLLAYYMLTSSVLHADDADLLRSADATKDNNVKYAPLYALCVRAAQFFVCTACFSGFYAQSALIPLIPILVMCVLVSVLPSGMSLVQGKPHRQSRASELESQMVRFEFAGKGVCSVAGVSTLRSAGFLCVAWTAIVCIVRAMGQADHSIWSSESTVYVGWGVVYFLAIAYSVYETHLARVQWEATLSQSGLAAATQALLQTLQSATVSESVLGKIVHTQQVPTTSAAVAGAFVSSLEKSRQRPVDIYTRKIQSVRSCAELAKILLDIEEDIITERMTCMFLLRRTTWVQELQSIIERSHDDEIELLRGQGPLAHSHAGNAVGLRQGSLLSGAIPFPPSVQGSPVEVDRALVDQLVEFNFLENSAIRAVRATRNGDVHACLDWLFSHQHDADFTDPLPGDHTALPTAAQGTVDFAADFGVHPDELNAQVETSQSARTALAVSPNNTTTAATTAPIAVSRSVARLLVCIQQLGDGISQHPAATHLSRQVFTIFMSRKVPIEVCWLIFSYSVSSQEMRDILLAADRSTGYAMPYSAMPLLRNPSLPLKTVEMLQYTGYFLHERRERIAMARTSAPELQAV